MRTAIDTSVLVALVNSLDLWHRQTRALQELMLSAGAEVVYFDCVITEAISTLARRLHEKGRGGEVTTLLSHLNSLVPSDQITWILPDVPGLYAAALDLVGSSSGELNFNDALIALACRERRIAFIASFDPDFDRLAWLKRVAQGADFPSA